MATIGRQYELRSCDWLVLPLPRFSKSIDARLGESPGALLFGISGICE
jgi:hypothetical protein